MVLRLNGQSGERLETLSYAPALQDSGDLEAATTTISAVAEPGVADYTSALTIGAPSDSRIAVLAIGVRLQVTIDSFGGGGAILNYHIKRGGVSVGTGTLSTGGSTGAKTVCHNVTTGTLTGAATYTVFLWTDVGTCVVSLCEIWVGVGHASDTASWGTACLSVTHAGMMQISAVIPRQGTGNFSVYFHSAQANNNWDTVLLNSATGTTATYNRSNIPTVILNPAVVYLRFADGTVATDLVYVNRIQFVVRSLIE